MSSVKKMVVFVATVIAFISVSVVLLVISPALVLGYSLYRVVTGNRVSVVSVVLKTVTAPGMVFELVVNEAVQWKTHRELMGIDKAYGVWQAYAVHAFVSIGYWIWLLMYI